MNALTATHRQTGFSLIELMISITLGLVLLGLAVPAFISNVQAFNFSTGVSRTQENARAALGELSRNIRMVGYTGCNSRDLPIVNLTGNGLYDMTPGLTGHERTGAEAIPRLDQVGITLTEAADAITLRTLSDADTVITAPIATAAQTVQIKSGHSVVAGDTIFIGDCEGAAVVAVAHVDASRLTLATPLTGVKRFSAGVDIYKVEVATYFLADSQLHTNNRSAVPTSLWRRINNDDPQELVVGVQALQFVYGVDTTGDGVANVFDTADALASLMHDVTIVRFRAITNSVDAVGSEGIISRPFSISVSFRNKVSS